MNAAKYRTLTDSQLEDTRFRARARSRALSDLANRHREEYLALYREHCGCEAGQ